MYYAYAYKDPITLELKYIGKGKNDRLNTHWRIRKFHYNQLFREYLLHLEEAGLRPIIEKIKSEMTSHEAYMEEFNLIRKYGRVGLDTNGILLNRSAGLEHFNVDFESLDESIVYDLLNQSHFNSIDLSEDEITLICEAYTVKDMSIVSICKMLSHGPDKIKNVLTSRGIHIRKRGGQLGKKNGMFGKRRPNNAFFEGRSHSDESKLKISENSKSKKPVRVNEVKYLSIKDAAAALSVTGPQLKYSIKTGKPIVKNGVKYLTQFIDSREF